jgi:hypothetical protein
MISIDRGQLAVIYVPPDEYFDPIHESEGWINFAATGVKEIVQNVKYIILTNYYSVPLDREFGFNAVMVDKPMPVAELVISQEIAMKIALYEPRCVFEEVNFRGEIIDGVEGKLTPEVKIGFLV